MWKIINLLWLLSTNILCTSATGSYIDNAIEKQHRVVNEMNQNFTDLEKASEKLIDLGTYVGKHAVPPKTIKITNTIAVKVPVPYPVKIPHPVPVPFPVNKPVPVPVTKLVKVPETTQVLPTVSTPTNYVTPVGYEPTTGYGPTAGPTAAALRSRSFGLTGSSQLLSGEQETAHSNTNEQIKEFMHSYPVHSVFDVGMDYNPYMGNRLGKSKQTASASEHHPSKHYGSGLEKLQEYSGPSTKHSARHSYHNFYPTPKTDTVAKATQMYHEYYSTAQPEATASAGQSYHSTYSTPQPDVVPHAYKSSKSIYFSKDMEKYPTPKFPRPTHSAFPTFPTFPTFGPTDASYGKESQYDGQSFKEYEHKSTPSAASYHTVQESYPHYEQPDLKEYHYQKPKFESYSHDYAGHSEQGSQQHKIEKYVEHYHKPTETSYTGSYHDSDDKETGESSPHFKHYEEQGASYLSNVESYPEHKATSEHYEGNDLYGKQSATPETYSHYESKEPQYTPQEYKSYYPKPSPVSEALTYLEEKEPSHHSEQKEYYVKPQSYRQKPHKEHKTRYSSKPSSIPYQFPSDSHLHPSYSETGSSKHKPHHYYASTPEYPSFDSGSEYKYYQHGPSPSPSSHITSYDHGEASGTSGAEYQQYSSHGSRHSAGADMLESSSKDHEAYEKAVEYDHRASHPNEDADFSHEHMHHHHTATDGRDY